MFEGNATASEPTTIRVLTHLPGANRNSRKLLTESHNPSRKVLTCIRENEDKVKGSLEASLSRLSPETVMETSDMQKYITEYK